MKFMPLFLKYTDPKEGKNAFLTTYVLKDWNCQFQFNDGEGYYIVYMYNEHYKKAKFWFPHKEKRNYFARLFSFI